MYEVRMTVVWLGYDVGLSIIWLSPTLGSSQYET